MRRWRCRRDGVTRADGAVAAGTRDPVLPAHAGVHPRQDEPQPGSLRRVQGGDRRRALHQGGARSRTSDRSRAGRHRAPPRGGFRRRGGRRRPEGAPGVQGRRLDRPEGGAGPDRRDRSRALRADEATRSATPIPGRSSSSTTTFSRTSTTARASAAGSATASCRRIRARAATRS